MYRQRIAWTCFVVGAAVVARRSWVSSHHETIREDRDSSRWSCDDLTAVQPFRTMLAAICRCLDHRSSPRFTHPTERIPDIRVLRWVEQISKNGPSGRRSQATPACLKP